MHIDTFNHNCSLELMRNAARLENLKQQEFEYFLVLDLEGKVEILEFPVLLFDAKTMDVVDLFHRSVSFPSFNVLLNVMSSVLFA